jgi:hypothetical protein
MLLKDQERLVRFGGSSGYPFSHLDSAVRFDRARLGRFQLKIADDGIVEIDKAKRSPG